MEIPNNLKLKVFAVIDTNVLVSFLKNTKGDSAVVKVGQMIESGNIIPLFDERMLSEYFAVLNYKTFNFLPEVIENMMNLVLSKGIYVKDIDRTVSEFFTKHDVSDVPFYQVTLSTQEISSTLVTGNDKHYPEGSSVSPEMLLSNMRYIEKMFGDMIFVPDYNQKVEKCISEMIESNKYFLAEHLPKDFVALVENRRLSFDESIDLDDFLP